MIGPVEPANDTCSPISASTAVRDRVGVGSDRSDRGARTGSGGAGVTSSSRKGRRAVTSAMTCTSVSPRVIATWKMRRSSSMSSASACGINPSCAPITTTNGHSIPFTRWTVDNATPSLPAAWSVAAQAVAEPRLERGGIGLERRDRDERVEVVAVARVGRFAREVEGRERGAEPDVVADAGEELVGGGAIVERAARALRGRRRTPRTCGAADAFSASASRRSAPRRHCRLRSSRCSISRRSERLGRRAASARSAPWKPVSLPAASARRRYASAVRVPVRLSTAMLTGRPTRHARFAEEQLRGQEHRVHASSAARCRTAPRRPAATRRRVRRRRARCVPGEW